MLDATQLFGFNDGEGLGGGGAMLEGCEARKKLRVKWLGKVRNRSIN